MPVQWHPNTLDAKLRNGGRMLEAAMPAGSFYRKNTIGNLHTDDSGHCGGWPDCGFVGHHCADFLADVAHFLSQLQAERSGRTSESAWTGGRVG